MAVSVPGRRLDEATISFLGTLPDVSEPDNIHDFLETIAAAGAFDAAHSDAIARVLRHLPSDGATTLAAQIDFSLSNARSRRYKHAARLLTARKNDQNALAMR